MQRFVGAVAVGAAFCLMGGPARGSIIAVLSDDFDGYADQAAFETACGDANQWMMAKYDAVNPPALRRLVAGGAQLRPFPRAVLEAAEKASYEVYEEMSAKSAHFKRIYPGWKAFRDEQFLWFRVAEQAYDNYTFNSKVGQPAAAAKGAKKA